jgi:hypothetical protein
MSVPGIESNPERPGNEAQVVTTETWRLMLRVHVYLNCFEQMVQSDRWGEFGATIRWTAIVCDSMTSATLHLVLTASHRPPYSILVPTSQNTAHQKLSWRTGSHAVAQHRNSIASTLSTTLTSINIASESESELLYNWQSVSQFVLV